MSSLIKLVLWMVGIGFGVISGCMAWDATAKWRGGLVAQWDLREGRVEILTYALPARWREDYAGILQQKYGIEMNVVAGCGVTNALTAYVEGYNEVVGGFAIRKFGRDVFGEVAREAEAGYRAKVR